MTNQDTKPMRWGGWGCVNEMSPMERRWMTRFNIFALAWAITSVFAKLLLKEGALAEGGLNLLVAAIPVLLLALAVIAFAHFLRVADELHRKIHYEAMAWGFAAGAIVMCLGTLLESLGMPKIGSATALLPAIFGWSLGMFFVTRRYS